MFSLCCSNGDEMNEQPLLGGGGVVRGCQREGVQVELT